MREPVGASWNALPDLPSPCSNAAPSEPPPPSTKTEDLVLFSTVSGDDDQSEAARRFLKAVAHAPPVDRVASRPCQGERLGRYRIVRELGRGGMGAVLEAEDELLARRVALKLLPSGAEATEVERQRLIAEARAATAANHPGLPTIYDVGEIEGRIFIAMELVQGQSLRSRLAQGFPEGFPVCEALRIVVQVARAIHAVHQAGIVHRDIKPENVMLEPSGAAKLVDFGLASGAAGAGPGGTPKRFSGTAGYAAPEQARGEEVDARADQYSLGVLLYELLTGGRPELDSDTRLRDAAEREGLRAAEVDRLVGLVRRCRAKTPEGRFPTAEVLAADAEQLIAQIQGVQTAELARLRAALAWVF